MALEMKKVHFHTKNVVAAAVARKQPVNISRQDDNKSGKKEVAQASKQGAWPKYIKSRAFIYSSVNDVIFQPIRSLDFYNGSRNF